METKDPSPHDAAVRRACLPEILFVPDIALTLLLSHSAARRAILRGECGPYSRIGLRLAVRRESFLAALEARQVAPQRGGLKLLRTDVHSRAPERTDARDDQDEDER